MATNEQMFHRFGKDLRSGADVSSIAFVVMAENDMLDDVTITEHADLFLEWDSNWIGKIGTIVRDPDDKDLYRKINTDFLVAYPQSQPSKDPSQWKFIGDPTDEWPDWSQPQGAHDAYEANAKVKSVDYGNLEDKTIYHWINVHGDGNSWPPGVYGWAKEI